MGRKRKIENQDSIFIASYKLFMVNGFDNVTVQDIEKESKVHRRNFYRYFENKNELLGAIIEAIEKQILEYIRPMLTDEPLFNFTLFSIIKYEFSIYNPDYFRLRASLVGHPNTFIKSFMSIFELSYPQVPDWKSDESTMLQALYILGGTLLVQYGFTKDLSGSILSNESNSFMTNYNIHELSLQTMDTFRRFTNYAIRNNLYVLGLSEMEVDKLLERVYLKIKEININGIREFYETALGFNDFVV